MSASIKRPNKKAMIRSPLVFMNHRIPIYNQGEQQMVTKRPSRQITPLNTQVLRKAIDFYSDYINPPTYEKEMPNNKTEVEYSKMTEILIKRYSFKNRNAKKI